MQNKTSHKDKSQQVFWQNAMDGGDFESIVGWLLNTEQDHTWMDMMQVHFVISNQGFEYNGIVVQFTRIFGTSFVISNQGF